MRWLNLALSVALAFAACKDEGTKTAPPPPEQKDQKAGAPSFEGAFKHEVTIDPARSSLLVKFELAPGFHAYTVGETVGKPLLVELESKSDLVEAGPVVYPQGQTKDLPVGKSVIVEGKGEVVVPLKARDGSPIAGKEATGSFRYQVCTDTACDRPRTAAFSVPAPRS